MPQPRPRPKDLSRFNWSDYFSAQRLLSEITYVITPTDEYHVLNGQRLDEYPTPELVYCEGVKGKDMDARRHLK